MDEQKEHQKPGPLDVGEQKQVDDMVTLFDDEYNILNILDEDEFRQKIIELNVDEDKIREWIVQKLST